MNCVTWINNVPELTNIRRWKWGVYTGSLPALIRRAPAAYSRLACMTQTNVTRKVKRRWLTCNRTPEHHWPVLNLSALHDDIRSRQTGICQHSLTEHQLDDADGDGLSLHGSQWNQSIGCWIDHSHSLLFWTVDKMEERIVARETVILFVIILFLPSGLVDTHVFIRSYQYLNNAFKYSQMEIVGMKLFGIQLITLISDEGLGDSKGPPTNFWSLIVW